MEYKGIASSSPSLEAWGDIAKYEAFVKELDGWKEEVKLSAMEQFPNTFDSEEEPIIEEAYTETLRRAQVSGPRAKEYFLKRLEIMRFQKHAAAAAAVMPAPTPAPVVVKETAPVVSAAEVVVEHTSTDETQPSEETEVVVAEVPEGHSTADTTPAVSDRIQKYAGYAERVRAVRANGLHIPTAPTMVKDEKQPEKPKGFEALEGFVPEKKFVELQVSREQDIVAPATPAEVPPEAVGETPQVASDPVVPVAPQENQSEATPAQASLEARVQRSIENGSFDLSLATGTQLEALQHHPDQQVVDRATAELALRARPGFAERGPTAHLPESSVTEQPDTASPKEEIAEPTPEATEGSARTPVTREVVLSTLREGRTIPPVFLKKFMNDPEIRALIDAQQSPAIPPAVAGIARVIPDAAAVEAARAAHEAATAIVVNEPNLAFSEVPEPVAPRMDGMAGGPDLAPVEEVIVPEVEQTPKTWSEMTDDEQAELTKACVLYYQPGQTYSVKLSDGSVESWALLSVSDEGSALLEKKLSPDDRQIKRVDLLTFKDLNPFDMEEVLANEAPSLEGITVTEEEVEAITAHAAPEIGELAEIAASRAEWNDMTLEDRAAFIGQCEFLFSIGKAYAIKRTSGEIEHWNLVSIASDGMANMASGDGKLEKRVPLRELFDLNVVSAHSSELLGSKEDEEQNDEAGELPPFPEMKPFVEEQFKETFGMGPEQLLAIPEFAALSEGQQLLVHHELNNYAVAQIKSEALKAYREKFQSLQAPLSDLEKNMVARKGITGSIAKMVVGVAQLRHKEMWQKAGMSIFKRKYIAEEEKALAEQFTSGAMDTSAYVRELALEAKEGPDAIIENGQVRLQFLKSEDLGSLSEQESATIRQFNEQANTFAKLPHRWKERGATAAEREQYEAGEAAYRNALDQVLVLFHAKGESADALLDVNELDRRITFTQFFNTHPEAAEQLASIKDQNVWLTALQDVARTRGTLFALGGTVRTAAAAAASTVLSAGAMFVAAPLAGAATGAYMGKKRAEAELADRAVLARAGVKDTSAEATNIVDAGSRNHESGRTLMGLSGKLNQLILEIESTDDKEITVTPLVRQSPNADGSRGEILAAAPLGETAGAEHELVGSSRALQRNKKADLLEQLERRVSYTQEKLDQGLVNFGSKEEQIQNQYTLLRAIAKAKALLVIEGKKEFDATPVDQSTGEAYDASWKKDTRSARERLSDLLALRDQQISEAQKTYVERTTKQAALYGAAFAFGGAVVADIVHGYITPGGSAIGRMVDEAPDLKLKSGEGAAVLGGAGLAGKEALVPSMQNGWDSPLVQKSLMDPVFTKDYVHGMSIFTNRSETVGMSDTELNALLATDDVPGREGAHRALVEAMRQSSTRLSDEGVAKIMTEHRIPTIGAAVSTPSAPAEVAPLAVAAHEVQSGENLSTIMRSNLPALKGLSSGVQENVIQNFLKTQTPEQLRAIGIANPNQLVVGQSIDLKQLNAALLEQKIQGVSLVDHAKSLYEGTPIPHAPTAPTAEVATPSAPTASTVAQEVVPPSTSGSVVAEQAAPSVPTAKTTPAFDGGPETAVIDRPRALTLAEEYITKDMTDPRTGKLSPLWVEGKGFNAQFVMTSKESDVTPELWKKILAVRKYTAAQGFDEAHRITPNKDETLEQFFRRAHAERIMQDGERGARLAAAAKATITAAPETPKPSPTAEIPRATGPVVEPTRLPRPNPNVEINTPVVPPAASTPAPAGYQYRSIAQGAGAEMPPPRIPAQEVPPPAQQPPYMETPPSSGYQYRRLP